MTQQNLYQHIKPTAKDTVLGEIFGRDGYDIVHCVPNRHYILDKKGHFPDRVYIHTMPSKKFQGYSQIHVLNLTQSPYFQAVYDKFHELIYCWEGLFQGKTMEYNAFLKRGMAITQRQNSPQSEPDFPVMIDIESPKEKVIPAPVVPTAKPTKKPVTKPVESLGILDFD